MQSVETKTVDAPEGNEMATRTQTTTTAPPTFRIQLDDETEFSLLKVSPFRHNYQNHPLMQLDRLEQLAKLLMRHGRCRFVTSGTTQFSQFLPKLQSTDGLSIEEVFRRIEEPGSWIGLYYVETDPEYDQFLREVLGTVKHLIDRQQPGTFIVNGFIFISAPPSATPFHIDRENNFWMQIRGRKTLNVWDPTDRQAVGAREVENFIVNSSLAGVKLQEELLARSHEFDTGPGDGVYFPSTSPHTTRCDTHWARPGDGVAISIGVNFYTSVTRRRAYIHAFNQFLRRLGVNPRSPGASTWMDGLKHPLGRILMEMRRRFWGRSPPAGF